MSPELRNITALNFTRALERDGFVFKRKSRGGHRVYQHAETGKRISVPFHYSGQTFGPGLIQQLIKAVGWSDEDLVRLRLVRK